MAKRTGGFIGQDGINAPDPATGVTGTAGNEQVTVSWTAPSDVGGAAIEYYRVQGSNGAHLYEPDLANGSYASKSFSVASQSTSSGGLALKSDGTSFYVGNESSSSGVVYQYDMTTAFDVSTASYASKSFDTTTQTTGVAGLHFHPDGTKMYAIGAVSNDSVFQYALSTAWDVSTASYESKSFNFSSQNDEGIGLYLGSGGTKMFIAGNTGDIIYQYTLSTAYDVSTASYDSVSFDVTSEDSAPQSMTFNEKGDIMLIGGAANVAVFQYNLTTPFSLSTASYSGISLSAQGANPAGLSLANGNEVLLNCDPSTDTVYQYTVAQPSGTSAVVAGLTNGTSYTFNVWAINPFGWSVASDASGSVTPEGLIALMSGGGSSGSGAVINKILIASIGNATDFGDLSRNVTSTGSVGGETRGLMGGGNSSSDVTIDFVTFATEGNATDFGDLTTGRNELTGTGNATRGLFACGAGKNVIDYVTIATTGNAIDFGDRTISTNDLGSLSSPTRAVFCGSGSNSNLMDYVTIASTGNAIDFGDLTEGAQAPACASSSTRGLIMAINQGSGGVTVNYITTASTGNATDFGDASVTRGSGPAGASSNTRALLGGGYAYPTPATNSIEYFTIASTGNGTDFGDLTLAAYRISGCSNAHGGLQ